MTLHRPAPRLDWVDTARGASILLVITYHAGLFATSVGLESTAWNVVNGASRVIRMPLFFFLSGMLAAGALRRPWPVLLRGRVTSNLYLYALWASLAFALFTVIPYTRDGAPRGLSHWAQSVFLLPENGSWYLLALALFLVTAKALSRFPTAVVLAVSSVVAAVASANVVGSSFVWNNCLLLFVFFLAGSRLKDRTVIAAPVLGRASIAVPLVVVAGLLSLLAAREDVLDVVGTRWALGAVAVVAGVGAAALCAATRVGRMLAVIGRDTLAVYVTHEMLLAVLVLPLSGIDATRWADGARWSAPVLLVLTSTSVALLLRRPLSAVPHLLRAPWTPRNQSAPADRDGGRATDARGPVVAGR